MKKCVTFVAGIHSFDKLYFPGTFDQLTIFGVLVYIQRNNMTEFEQIYRQDILQKNR